MEGKAPAEVPWQDSDLEHVSVISKYLQALHNRVFDPASPNFNVRWRLTDAPDVDPLESQDLIAHACGCARGAWPSPTALSNFLRLLSFQVSNSENWSLLNLGFMLVPDLGLQTMKHALAPVFIATVRLFSLPQLQPPPAMLLARRWDGGSGASPLPIALWHIIASFLDSTPAAVGWWDSARHPLAILMTHQGRANGVSILKPPKAAVEEFFEADFIQALATQRLNVKKDWEKEGAPEIRRWLLQASGLRGKTISAIESAEPTVRTGLNAVGLYTRLRVGVPAFLVGDCINELKDVALIRVVAAMCQCEHEVVNVGPSDAGDIQALARAREGADGVTLLLLRCSDASLERCSALLRSIEEELLGNREMCKVKLLASFHYTQASTIHLREHLPAKLRDMAICI